MATTGMPLFQELARVADSNDIRDQLAVLFMRSKVRDAYIEELQMFQVFHCSDEVVESLEIMKGMQLDDIEKASRLVLMDREV
ncbi:hypothetical protein Tco_0752710 [Tanacetum coccineum]|uniref:Uncharacterized protein n=1 Tax=Tanacetum coccineum TaxID=301880 RepID=A0ABQ4Z7L6_9ASTR